MASRKTLTEKLRITSFNIVKGMYERGGIPYVIFDEKTEILEDLRNKLIGMREPGFKNLFASPADSP